MKNEKLLQHVLTLTPPIAAGVGAWIVHAKFYPFTFNSESAFGALREKAESRLKELEVTP